MAKKSEKQPKMPVTNWIGAAPKAPIDTNNPKGRDITIDDIHAWHLPGNPQVSPDGTRIVYEVLSVDKDANEYRSTLWMIDGDEAPRKLTSGQWKDTSPRWSPDGTTIAFVSTRADKSQLFLLPIDGGEATQITDIDTGVGQFVWSPNGKKIAFLSRVAPEKKGDSDVKVITSAHYKFDGLGFIDDKAHHIFIVKVKGGKHKQLTSGPRNHTQITFAPDGKHITFVSNQTKKWDLRRERDIWTINIKSKKKTRLTDGKGQWGHPTYSPNGKWLAIIGNKDAYAEDVNSYLFIMNTDGGELKRLGKDLDRAVGDTGMSGPAGAGGETIRWTADSKAIDAIVSDLGDTHVVRFPRRGSTPTCLTPKGRHIKAFDHIGDDVVVAGAEPARPVELCRISKDKATRLTHHNDDWVQDVFIPQPEEIWYESDGEMIQGWLIRPRGNHAQSKKKVPLILNIHGGPHAQFSPAFFHELQMYVARGWALVFVNPRGSTGRSNEFGRGVIAKWGFADMPDFMAAVNHVLALGGIDGERMGVTGGSYGGFSTNWLLGHTDRFKVAVTDRSISNMASMYGTDDISMVGFDLELGTPWGNPEGYWEASPLAYVENVKAPCLIIHSEEDHRCPMEQAEQWFMALKNLGVPTEFVRFPNESHGLGRTGQPKHRVERLERTLNWFEKYL